MTDQRELEIILDKADDTFLASVRSFQQTLFASVRRIISRFSRNGTLENDDSTRRQLLLSLRTEVRRLIDGSDYADSVRNYLLNFDEAQILKTRITEGLKGSALNRELSALLTEEKRQAIQAVQFSLLSDNIIDAQFVTPLRRILTRQITLGISEEEAVRELREFIVGNQSAGYYERYVRTIARESISRYEGLTTQLILEQTGASYFRISGTLINNSHINCSEMINGTGRLGRFHIGGGIYPICVLDEMLTIMRGRSGFVSGTNQSNYFVNRNHYGCRHLFSPVFTLPPRFRARAAEIEETYCG